MCGIIHHESVFGHCERLSGTSYWKCSHGLRLCRREQGEVPGRLDLRLTLGILEGFELCDASFDSDSCRNDNGMLAFYHGGWNAALLKCLV